MNPYRAYQQQAQSAWFRTDILLALYDQALKDIEGALAALRRRDRPAARPLLAHGRLVIAGLVSCVVPDQSDLSTQFLRLYDFVNFSLGRGGTQDLEGALKVLRTLREGLEKIRPEAVEFERTSRLPPPDVLSGIRLTV